MEPGAGMVAVVRGLQDTGLAVTLLEGGKEYTLVPSSAIQHSNPRAIYPVIHGHQAQGHQMLYQASMKSTATGMDKKPGAVLCDSYAQTTEWNLIPISSPNPDVSPVSKSNSPHRQGSPTRDTVDSWKEKDHQTTRGNSEHSKACKRSEYKGYESPCRGPRKEEPDSRRVPVFVRNYDVRYLRGLSRPGIGTIRNVSESLDNDANSDKKADIQRNHKETSTSPSPTLSIERQTEAVPPSPRTSLTHEEGAVSTLPPEPRICKSIQTTVEITPIKMLKSIQTTLSSVEITPHSNSLSTRRSKSEAEIKFSKEHIQKQVMQWLEDIFTTNKKPGREDVIEKLNAKLNRLTKKKTNEKEKGTVKEKCMRFSSIHEECLRNHSPSRRKYFRFCTQVYRAELSYNIFEDDEHKTVIAEWLNGVSLKDNDFLNRPVKKEQLLLFIINTLKHIALRTDFDDKRMKSGIIDMLDDMPIDYRGFANKRAYMNSLASTLMDRLKRIDLKKSRKKWSWPENNAANVTRPTDLELRLFVEGELQELMYRSNVKIGVDKLREVVADIVSVILDSIQTLRHTSNTDIEKTIAALLRNTDKIFGRQADYFANILIRHLREMLQSTDKEQAAKNNHNTFMVQRHECNRSGQYNHEPCASTSENPQNSQNHSTLTSTRELRNDETQNAESNLKSYLNELSYQIDEWLNTIQMHLPQAHDPNFRKLVIEDLAGDLIDRHRYRELNSSKRCSDNEELEHLRYQIFKWVNKLAGENNTATLQRAPELMHRIRNVPVPKLIKLHSPTNTNVRQALSNRIVSEQTAYASTSTGFKPQLYELTVNVSQLETDPQDQNIQPMSSQEASAGACPPSCDNENLRVFKKGDTLDYNNSLVGMNREQLSEHFEQFLQDWVQQIPINEDKELADKMRVGLVNGVWKAIAKVNSVPTNMLNSFCYQDMLDDELDELLSLVPSNPELERKKNALKSAMIKKATAVHNQIKRNFLPKKFKHQLVVNVNEYVPRTKTRNFEAPDQQTEELLILYLVEEYILFTNYKDEDQVKANVYKTKLLRRAQELVDELKRTHSQELKDINPDLIMNNVISALQRVPLPSENTIREEADEILLGMEIEQWFQDLPLIQSNDKEELLKRRRLRERLTRKIYELEKSIDMSDESSADRAIRNEVSLFLKRVPMEKDETLNINFMVDELTNRMKNRQRGIGIQHPQGKSVVFADGMDYDDFSRNLNFHSSFTNGPAFVNPGQQQQMFQPMSMMQPNQPMPMLQQVPMQMQSQPFNQPAAIGENRTFSPTGHTYPVENYGRAYTSAPSQCGITCQGQNQAQQAMGMSYSYHSENLPEPAMQSVNSQAANDNSMVSMFDATSSGVGMPHIGPPPKETYFSPQRVMQPGPTGNMPGSYMPQGQAPFRNMNPISNQWMLGNSGQSDFSDASYGVRVGPMTDVLLDPDGYRTFEQHRPLESSAIAGAWPGMTVRTEESSTDPFQREYNRQQGMARSGWESVTSGQPSFKSLQASQASPGNKKCDDSCPRKQGLVNSLRSAISPRSRTYQSGSVGGVRSMRGAGTSQQTGPSDLGSLQNASTNDSLPPCCRPKAAPGGGTILPSCCRPKSSTGVGLDVSGRSGGGGASGMQIVPYPRDQQDSSSFDRTPSSRRAASPLRASRSRELGGAQRGARGAPGDLGGGGVGSRGRPGAGPRGASRGGPGGGPWGGTGGGSGGGAWGGPGGGSGGPWGGQGGPRGGAQGAPRGPPGGRPGFDGQTGTESDFERFRCKCMEGFGRSKMGPCYPGESFDSGFPFHPMGCYCPYYFN